MNTLQRIFLSGENLNVNKHIYIFLEQKKVGNLGRYVEITNTDCKYIFSKKLVCSMNSDFNPIVIIIISLYIEIL